MIVHAKMCVRGCGYLTRRANAALRQFVFLIRRVTHGRGGALCVKAYVFHTCYVIVKRGGRRGSRGGRVTRRARCMPCGAVAYGL